MPAFSHVFLVLYPQANNAYDIFQQNTDGSNYKLLKNRKC